MCIWMYLKVPVLSIDAGAKPVKGVLAWTGLIVDAAFLTVEAGFLLSI